MGIMSKSPLAWAATTAGVALAVYVLVWPSLCKDVAECSTQHVQISSTWHTYAAIALAPIGLSEAVNAAITFYSSRETKVMIPDVKSRCLPSTLLAITLFVLVMKQSLFASGSRPWFVHTTDSLHSRPVYAITYVEWLVNVPFLMVLSGYCALGTPFSKIARPVVLTNIYIVFSWAALVVDNFPLRWSLVIISFVMYFYASYDMALWVVDYLKTAPADMPSRRLRTSLSLGLIAVFAVYGAVYLAGIYDLISPASERLWLLCLDCGAKLASSIVFVAIRCQDYHHGLTVVVKHVGTTNAAMQSILRGSFDLLLPCTVEEDGSCWLPDGDSSDIMKLKDRLGCSSLTRTLGALLADTQDFERFKLYMLNTLSQSEFARVHGATSLLVKMDGTAAVAQVLNCRLLSLKDGSQGSIAVSIHLSVVPRSLMSVGLERQFVVAIRFEGEEVVECRDDHPAFGIFDAEEVMDEIPIQSRIFTQDSDDEPNNILASLKDMARLGMFAESSRASDSESIIVPSWASTSGAFGSKTRQALKSLRGTWEGFANEKLGGYAQAMGFLDDGVSVRLGTTVVGRYIINCDQVPYHMDLQVWQQAGGISVRQITSYIFKINGDELHLCSPSGAALERPSSFAGSGYCIMHKVNRTAAKLQTSVAESVDLAQSDVSFNRQVTMSEPEPDYRWAKTSKMQAKIKAVSIEPLAEPVKEQLQVAMLEELHHELDLQQERFKALQASTQRVGTYLRIGAATTAIVLVFVRLSRTRM